MLKFGPLLSDTRGMNYAQTALPVHYDRIISAAREASRQKAFAKHFTVDLIAEVVYSPGVHGGDRWIRTDGTQKTLVVNIGGGRTEADVFNDVVAGFSFANHVGIDTALSRRFHAATVSRLNALVEQAERDRS